MPTSKSTTDMRIVHAAQQLAIKEAVQMARNGSFDNAQAMMCAKVSLHHFAKYRFRRSASSSSLSLSQSATRLHKTSSTTPHHLSTIVEEKGSTDIEIKAGQPTASPPTETEQMKREVRFIVADEDESHQPVRSLNHCHFACHCLLSLLTEIIVIINGVRLNTHCSACLLSPMSL